MSGEPRKCPPGLPRMARRKKHVSVTCSDFDQLKSLSEEGIHRRFEFICSSYKGITYPKNATRYRVTQTPEDISFYLKTPAEKKCSASAFVQLD
jgi:hypothetical protein